MLTVEEIQQRAAAMRFVAIEEVDRDEFAVALVLQGYDAPRAHRMAYAELEDNDGALQMLARHRIRFSARATANTFRVGTWQGRPAVFVAPITRDKPGGGQVVSVGWPLAIITDAAKDAAAAAQMVVDALNERGDPER